MQGYSTFTNYRLSGEFVLPIMLQFRAMTEVIQQLEDRNWRLQAEIDKLELKVAKMVRGRNSLEYLCLPPEARTRLIRLNKGIGYRLSKLTGLSYPVVHHTLGNRAPQSPEIIRIIRSVIDPLIEAQR